MSQFIPQGSIPPNKKHGIEPSDVFYTKKARTSPGSAKLKIPFVEYTAKGHYIGLCLGHVPQDKLPPDKNSIFRLLAGIGWISSDDICEIFGEENWPKVVEHLQKKYPETITAPPEPAKVD